MACASHTVAQLAAMPGRGDLTLVLRSAAIAAALVRFPTTQPSGVTRDRLPELGLWLVFSRHSSRQLKLSKDVRGVSGRELSSPRPGNLLPLFSRYELLEDYFPCFFAFSASNDSGSGAPVPVEPRKSLRPSVNVTLRALARISE